jgi:hypothetical protein
MSLASAARKTLHRRTALLQANIGVLGQKLDLMTALRSTLGPKQASQRFAEKCPIVGASVGQHFRHSTDHMERVANSIEAEKREDSEDDSSYERNKKQLHYDIRVRGGNDENDMDAAEERIRRVTNLFQEEIDATMIISSSLGKSTDDKKSVNNKVVLACFMLSGDPTEDEFLLSSTIERELGFVAHHAIHHLAMVKIITMHTLKLLPTDAIPEGFGMAPSTIVYDNSQQQR